MTGPFVTTGIIRSGDLKLRHGAAVKAWAAHQKDGEYTVVIDRLHAIRSLEANRYYFGVVLTVLSAHTGYTVDELHEWAKLKFLPKYLALCDGNGEVKGDFVIGGTTTRLNRLQFYEFVESIRRFAAEALDVNIPDPDPGWSTRSDETESSNSAHVAHV